MKIAYILDCFPVLSETFIVREILELKKNFFNVLIFARVNTSDDQIYSEVIHDDTKKLIADVCYISSLLKKTKLKRWSMLVLLHLLFLFRNPVRYVQTLSYSISKGKTIFTKFVFSVFFAWKLKKAEVNHMHVHFALHACTLAMLISKLSGIPYSFTVHAHDIFTPNLADLLEDKFNNAKFSVCISEFNKQYVLRQFPSIKKGSIQIVHCGLDLSAFSPKTKSTNKTITILAIGRLVEHKGFRYLIEACKKVKEEIDLDFTCNIIGEGEERTLLEDLIAEFKLTGIVHLLGSMEQLDVVNALKNADIFILPCVTEEEGMQDGIPVVLMEAMAMKIPVISTMVSGVPELIREESGILVEPGNAKSLASAIKELIQKPSGEKDLMGTRGRLIIEDQFNIVKEAQKLAVLMTN